MDTQGWERVKELFHEVLKKDAADRERLLTRESLEVRAEVEALLRAHEEAGPGPTEGPTAEEGPGSVIGRYKLLQEIGSGGFGVVYLAEQSEPIRRKVALKIIKLGMDTKQVVARFEAERQALALMDHPNIAKVLDGGATPHGRPYFVMELVKGIPLTEYCDKAGLDTAERLALFAEVCRAVQHAHQKGIIHRDLKPANVLVTLHDGRPVPKVIDFGIAKATDRVLTEKTLFTEFRQIIGTPEYMAPEQAELTSLDVDTRADVYSLGVLLYELLTDTKPFDVTRLLEQGYQEMLRTLKEVDPPCPSTRLSTLGDQLPVVAKKRHTPPQALSRLLKGDLDWIVMKALEKDRSRRYDTAAALADDIHRHLKDEPVEAGPPSRLYRLRKYAKRNRVGVLAAAAVLVALVGGLVAASLSLAEARRQATAARRAEGDALHQASLALDAEQESRRQATLARDAEGEALRHATLARDAEKEALHQAALARDAEADAARQRDDATASREQEVEQRTRAEAGEAEARKEALRAKTALGLVEQALSAANPHNSKSPGYTVRQLLADIERDLDEKVKGQPEIEASVRHTIGAAYNGLGLHRQAKPHLERALAVRRELHGDDHERTLETRYEWAHVLRAEGRVQEAAEATREVWEATTRLFGAEHTDAVRTGLAYAKDLVDLARYDEADAVIQPVRRTAHEVLGPRSTLTLETDTVLSFLRVREGRIDEAEVVAHESFDRIRELCGEDSSFLAYPLGQLVHVTQARGHYEQAETYARRLCELHRKTLGVDHPWTMTARYRLADVVRQQGRLDEARAPYEEVLAFFRAHQPDDPHTTAVALNNLAELERLAGNYALAERYLKEALDISSQALGEDHPNCAIALSALGSAHMFQSRYAEAEAFKRRGRDILERTYGAHHPLYAGAVEGLGILANTQGHYAEAERQLRVSSAIYEEAFGGEHATTARGWANLANCLLEQGCYAEAEELYLRSYRTLAKMIPDHAHVGAALNSLGEVYRRTGRLDKAAKYLEDALEFQAEKLGPRHVFVATTLGNLGLVHQAAGRFPASRTCFDRALEILRAACGERHPYVALTLSNLAGLEMLLGELASAEQHLEAALEIYEMTLGPRCNWVGRILVELSYVLAKQERHKEALQALERASSILRETYGSESELTLMADVNRASTRADLGDPRGALDLLGRLRPRVIAAVGEDHLLTSILWHSMARAAGAAGRSQDAVTYAERAVGIIARAEPGGPNELQGRSTLAKLLHESGRWAEAAAQWEKVVALSRRMHGPQSRTVSMWLSWYGPCLEYLGRYDEAIEAVVESLAIRREAGDAEWTQLPQRTMALDGLRARRLLHRGERAAAEKAFRQILEDHAETLAREDALSAEFLSSFGISFQALGLYAEAEELFRASRALYARLQGPQATTTLGAATRLGLVLVAQEKYDEAVAVLEGALESDRLHPASRATIEAVLGMSLLATGEPAAAERVLRACATFRKQAMPGHWLYWNAVSLLGQSLADQERFEEAEPLLLEGYEKMDPPAVNAHRKEQARARLVQLYEGWGKPEMADRWRAPSEGAPDAPDEKEEEEGVEAPASPDIRTR